MNLILILITLFLIIAPFFFISTKVLKRRREMVIKLSKEAENVQGILFKTPVLFPSSWKAFISNKNPSLLVLTRNEIIFLEFNGDKFIIPKEKIKNIKAMGYASLFAVNPLAIELLDGKKYKVTGYLIGLMTDSQAVDVNNLTESLAKRLARWFAE